MAEEYSIISRAEAKARGLSRYFTGRPCPRGHIAEKWVTNKTCLICRREKRRKTDIAYRTDEERRFRRLKSWKRYSERNKEKRRADDFKRRQQPGPIRDAYLARRRELMASRRRPRTIKTADEKAVSRAEQNRRWRTQNREYLREYARRYYREKPNKIAALHKRRARKNGNGSSVTPADLVLILEKQKHRCIYCRANLTKVRKHLDHIVPLILGGAHEKSNLQYTCATCNGRKHAKDPIIFAQELGRLL